MARKVRPCVELCPLHHLWSSLVNTTLGMPTISLELVANPSWPFWLLYVTGFCISGMSLDHITLLRLGRLLPSWCEVSLYPAPWGGWGLYFMEVPF